MAVTSFKLKPEARGRKKTQTADEATRIYLAITDSKDDDETTVLEYMAALPVPIEIGAALDSKNEHLVLDDIDIQPEGSRDTAWNVTLRYRQISGSGTPDENPLLRPPEVEWGGETELRAIFKDAEDTPIVNSAGERFETLPEREQGELTLTYTRNELNPDFMLLRQYMHVVNDSGFTIDGKAIPARVAKLHIDRCPKVHEGGYTYYRVTYVFKFNAETWDTAVLDVGFNELDGSDLVPILDADGMEITRPWPLDGAGAAKDSPDATPETLTFKYYPEKDFSVLNFS